MEYSESIKSIYRHLAAMGIYHQLREGLIASELAAYNEGFLLLEQRLMGLKKDRFVDTASSGALKLFEQLVGLPPRGGTNSDSRRKLILNRMGISGEDFTAKSLQKTLMGAGISCGILVLSPMEISIRVTEILDPALTMSQIEHYTSLLVPAHIRWSIDLGTITFDSLDKTDYTFDSWDSRETSWDEFDKGDETILT